MVCIYAHYTLKYEMKMKDILDKIFLTGQWKDSFPIRGMTWNTCDFILEP